MAVKASRINFFVDSADRDAVAPWLRTGMFEGVTTNPQLMREAGQHVSDIENIYLWARAAGAREVCFQVWGATADEVRGRPRIDLDAARALAVVNETEETTRRLLVVGHMPWVQELGMRLMSLDSDQDAALRMSEHYPTLGMQVFRVEKPWAELDGRDAALTHFVVPGR